MSRQAWRSRPACSTSTGSARTPPAISVARLRRQPARAGMDDQAREGAMPARWKRRSARLPRRGHQPLTASRYRDRRARSCSVSDADGWRAGIRQHRRVADTVRACRPRSRPSSSASRPNSAQSPRHRNVRQHEPPTAVSSVAHPASPTPCEQAAGALAAEASAIIPSARCGVRPSPAYEAIVARR